MEKEKEFDEKTNKKGWEAATDYFQELTKTREAQRELMERFKGNSICSEFFAFERKYSGRYPYLFGTAYDFRDEDEDDDIRPY